MRSAGPPSLELWQIKDIQSLRRTGWTISALAADYGVSRRTIYRYVYAKLERITVDGWTAWFVLNGEKRVPQRLTPWEPA